MSAPGGEAMRTSMRDRDATPPAGTRPPVPRDSQSPMGRRLGQLLVAESVITEAQLGAALGEQTRTNDKLGAVLVRQGAITEQQLAGALGRVCGIPMLSPLPDVPPEVLQLVPARIARKHEVVPIRRTPGSLTLAMADPTNLPALDDVVFVTGLRVVPVVAPPSVIRRAIEQGYGPAEPLGQVETELEIEVVGEAEGPLPVDVMELRASADQAPVVRVVNTILLDAVRRGASDVHLESGETALRIRFRVDGLLHDAKVLPKRLEAALVSRLKIMANLDIAERRLPQDGRIKLRHGTGREIDFRVNVLPSMFGESASLRILDKESLRLDLIQLGFEAAPLDLFQRALRNTTGMILITGPTSSGKTTTLYSAIHALNAPHTKVLTVEDPVEYHLPGITQVPANEEIGRTFSAILRSFLRHDPDIILVGEMRDTETAQIAVRAALTGHLVLSTLHTNDCPTTIARLLDMGIPPFLVASSLRLVVAQRLVRKVCAECRVPYEASEESLTPYGYTPDGSGRRVLYTGRGCPACSFTGLKGRIAVFEVMPVSAEIRELISAGAPTGAIRDVARHQGMYTLREAGLRRVLEGLTTADEVLRVTAE
jgi:type IV pilus assembly protein PilB